MRCSEMGRISVRISEDDANEVYRLVESGEALSASEVIRLALDDFFHNFLLRKYGTGSTKKMGYKEHH